MRSWLIGTGLAVALGMLAAPLAGAQEKKELTKKVEKPQPPKYADPAKLDDPDFTIQGEYVFSGSKKVGAQVVALGNGKFDVRLLEGGLPGAGWDGKTQYNSSAQTVEGKVVVDAKGQGVSGFFGKEGLTLDGLPPFKGGTGDVLLTKVERKSPTLGEKPPEGGIVLFGGPDDVEKWAGGKIVELSDGKFLNMGVKSKQTFQNFKLHLEFRLPYQPQSRGQGRANSGVYLQDRYEIQVLDSFGLKGENNECGGIYGFKAPDVNMCLPPMVWQTYDIEFTAALFGADGQKTKPARVTAYHNGVKIHDNVELKGESGGGQKESDKPGPFQLQNHGDPLVFRNIWVVESK